MPRERFRPAPFLLVALAAAGLGGCSSQSPPPAGACSQDSECLGSQDGPICDPLRRVCVVCVADKDCMGQGPSVKCDRDRGRCGECLGSSDCLPGKLCRDGRCRPGCNATAPCPKAEWCLPGGDGRCVECIQNPDCNAKEKRCDVSAYRCVDCLVDVDCPAGSLCKARTCVPGCTVEQHCGAAEVCDLTRGLCVQCTVDSDCPSGSPRCETHLNKCVACLPGGGDNCPPGNYCGKDLVCAPGCRGDVDCKAGSPSPASKGLGRCDLSANACVACVANSDCPQQKVCGLDHTCTTGCKSDAQCGSGESCCGGQCQALSTSAHCGVCSNSCGKSEGCCGAQCIATNTVHNCGGCGLACAAGESCCGAGCVSPFVDGKNCGGCGVVCGSSLICCSGTCKDVNTPGLCVDCTKACLSYTVAGTDFAAGTIDSLDASAKGLATLSASQSPPPAKSPHVWVTNFSSNQVSRLDAQTGQVLGTYSANGGNPSAGAMALDGSLWLGNRGQSCDPNDPNCSNVIHMAPDGTTLCKVGKASDGQPLPFVRAIALDGSGYVWAGTWNDGRIHKIDPSTCKTLADYPMVFNGQTAKPGAFAIDGKGMLWNSSLGTGPFLELDTASGKFLRAVDATPYTSSGIAIDKKNNVYFGLVSNPYQAILRVDGTTFKLSLIPGTPQGNYQTSGLTLDSDGNLWASWQDYSCGDNCGTAYAAKFLGGTGAFVKSFAENALSNVVSINGDGAGNVWMFGYLNGKNSYGAIRFPKGIKADNERDFAVKLDGGYPNATSDLTGILNRLITTNNAQKGTWLQSFDGKSQATQWTGASFAATTPKGSSIAIRFAAAPTYSQLGSVSSWCGPFTSSPIDLTQCKFGAKQWLVMQVELSTSDISLQPVMSSTSVYYQF